MLGGTTSSPILPDQDHRLVHLTRGDVGAGQSENWSRRMYYFGIFGAPFNLDHIAVGVCLASQGLLWLKLISGGSN